MKLTDEQSAIIKSTGKRVVVSASAGSGKTFVLVEKLINLLCDQKVPASKLLVLTFTKAAAREMKSRLQAALLEQKPTPFVLQQIDDVLVSDIATIDAFCEKIIKRNISKLDLDEGFTVLDERAVNSLKHRAFQSAVEKFSKNEKEFEQIYFAFKKNKDDIEKCIYDMQSFFDALSDKEEVKKSLTDEYDLRTEQSIDFIKEKIEEKLLRAEEQIANAKSFADLSEKVIAFVDDAKNQLTLVDHSSLFMLCKTLEGRKLLTRPRTNDEEVKKCLELIKKEVTDAQNIAKNFAFLSEEEFELLRQGALPKALLKLYEIYEEKYTSLKKARAGLDFADIERYAQKLLQDEEVKASLQEKYDYIFIDEYQDTNKLQESILKPIAEGGYFTAVGDVKQGIYGFRNASKEIMLQDIQDFENAKDGQALYLTGNFRTESSILSFVNDVFNKIMTTQSAGINYQDKSQLVGLANFKEGKTVSVSVDVVCQPKEEKEKIIRSGIYSVEQDEIQIDEDNLLEVSSIETRINEVLDSEIYDAKKECYRKVLPSDIALLFRKRSSLMKDVVSRLQSRGFAVEADIKNSLLEDSQIKLICSLLRLTLNKEDDISLASVMNSPFGGFSLQELAQIRKQNEGEEFFKLVLESEGEKIASFLQGLDEFSFNCQAYGILTALSKLFEKTNYMQYLKGFADYNEKLAHIGELFRSIRACGYQFKPMAIISMLEQNTKQKAAAEGSVDAITVTTIHATKGLEYPIVILCGSGDTLAKPYRNNYILTSRFGLGTCYYDYEDDRAFQTPAFVAGKLQKAKEEFESELMIFYVALTRAQNHLFIVGKGKMKDGFTFNKIEDQKNYLQMIMFALGKNFTQSLLSSEKIQTKNRRFSVITQIDEDKLSQNKKIIKENNLQNYQEKIKNYQEFSYKNKSYCQINYKNSVTGLLKLEEENENYLLNNLQANENSVQNSNQNAIDVGNAYHQAIKLIELKNIKTLQDLEREIEKNKDRFSQGYLQLINNELLYNNILTINKLISDQVVFKEQEFLLKCPVKDIIPSCQGEESVIVQGIVDFFAIGKENILIDFKFSSVKSEEIIKERYRKQIQLYTQAIEKGFDIKIDKSYILSLKYNQLIEI